MWHVPVPPSAAGRFAVLLHQLSSTLCLQQLLLLLLLPSPITLLLKASLCPADCKSAQHLQLTHKLAAVLKVSSTAFMAMPGYIISSTAAAANQTRATAAASR